MYEELTRRMNARERAILDELVTNTQPSVTVPGTFKWVLLWTGGIVLCALAAVALISLGVHPIVGGIIGGPLALAAIICLYAIIMLISGHLHWSHNHRAFIHRDIPEIHAALKDGNVSVKKVSAKAVIAVVEFEDEGSGYIYEVGNGKLLFLKGQRFFPVADEMSWPNTEFEIVRTVHGDRWIGVFCSGRELAPVRELAMSECIDDIVWADREELVAMSMEEFAMSITRVA